MIVDSTDLFDESIELTKASVEAQIEIEEANGSLPGENVPEVVIATEPTPEPVTTTTEPVPAPENPPIVTTEEASDELQRLRAEAQAEYEERLEESKNEFTSASIVVMEITKDLKEAKRRMKEALEEFFNLQISGPQLPTSVPHLEGSSTDKKKKSADSKIIALPDDLEALIESDKTWRDIPIGEVLSGIQGLGTKKHDAISEMYSNLGQLEDARGQASKEFKPFQDFLPERIGPTMADKIQERCFDVMKSHWDKLRKKIAVANKTELSTEGDKPVIDSSAIEQEPQGVVISTDDALLDDSDLI
jgi:hypothetical protein